MEKQALIDMLNNDLADEHAAVIRYLIHGWMEGEDSDLGQSLISISREEMWHMHWLGMVIGRLGGEVNLKPNPYPHDPSSRAGLLRSYIEYEEKLIPHYNDEAARIADPHIRRVLKREAWESAIHSRKFSRNLEKLSQEEKAGLPENKGELPEALLNRLQATVKQKYQEMLRHLAISWRSQRDELLGWMIMDQAMNKMKHLAHLAEEVAEDGHAPDFPVTAIAIESHMGAALKRAIEDVEAAEASHSDLLSDATIRESAGLVINLDLMVQQERYQADEMRQWHDERA